MSLQSKDKTSLVLDPLARYIFKISGELVGSLIIIASMDSIHEHYQKLRDKMLKVHILFHINKYEWVRICNVSRISSGHTAKYEGSHLFNHRVVYRQYQNTRKHFFKFLYTKDIIPLDNSKFTVLSWLLSAMMIGNGRLRVVSDEVPGYDKVRPFTGISTVLFTKEFSDAIVANNDVTIKNKQGIRYSYADMMEEYKLYMDGYLSNPYHYENIYLCSIMSSNIMLNVFLKDGRLPSPVPSEHLHIGQLLGKITKKPDMHTGIVFRKSSSMQTEAKPIKVTLDRFSDNKYNGLLMVSHYGILRFADAKR